MTNVPFLDLKAHHAPLLDEINAAVNEVVAKSAFAGGPFVAAFEEAFAAYCGAGHFEEHYQTFVASPFVYQQAQRYRALIHGAMQSRDWAQIGLGPKLAAAPKPPKN